MFRILEARSQPDDQTLVSETIATLCNRLSSSTLLEDRRASVLGLRSFAKEYPASVSSGGLTGLIGTLERDREDIDTTRAVLETILNLFSPLDTAVEPSDDIALWIADQFTQQQDKFDLLLALVESSSFLCRLYSIEIITATARARPAKTQQCILSAPLGTTRLVGALRDQEMAVRSAATFLLSDLSTTSPELQKLVAYEGAFDAIFDNVEADGGLGFSSLVAEESLSLMASLVRHNSSNQTLFRTSGGINRIHRLFVQEPPAASGDAAGLPSAGGQWDRNVWGLLVVMRLFLTEGGICTHENQSAFTKENITEEILHLAFSAGSSVRVRSEALNTAADLIRSNKPLQEQFAMFQVVPFYSTDKLGQSQAGSPQPPENQPAPFQTSPIIEALLDLILKERELELFDVRLAATSCITSYFDDHIEIKQHFLRRTIEGHESGQDEVANVISTLIESGSYSGGIASDPYQTWFSSLILASIVHQDPDSKATLQLVREGKKDEEEEEMSIIQAISGNLIPILQQETLAGIERTAIALLMLLAVWLFETPAAVNDLLEDGSILHVLTVYITRPVMTLPAPVETTIIRGLCAVLLGVVYDFSRKDSPIPRREIQTILLRRLGRDKFHEVLFDFRHEPLLRDFEALPQGLASIPLDGGLPVTFFTRLFVDFFKERVGRISKSIDRDPGKEFHPASEEGIDRDILDELRTELDTKTQELQEAQEALASTQSQLDQEAADHRREAESKTVQLALLRETLEKEATTQLETQKKTLEEQISTLQTEHEAASKELESARMNITSLQHQASKAETMSRQAVAAREEVSRQLAKCEEEKRRAIADGTRSDHAKAQAIERLSKVQQELESERARAGELEVRFGTVSAEVRILKEGLAKLSKERDDLVSVNKSSLDTTKRQKSEMAELQAQIRSKDGELAASKRELERAAWELAETKRSLEASKAQLKTATARADAATSTAAELPGLRAKLEEKTAELVTARSDLADARVEREESLESLDKVRDELQAVKQGQADELAEREAALEKRAAEVAARERAVAAAAAAAAAKEKEKNGKKSQKKGGSVNGAGATDVNGVGQGLDEAKAKVKELEEALSAAERARQTVQGDMDDLLLVLADLEEKKVEYKTKVRELGGDVSDEGENEDEE